MRNYYQENAFRILGISGDSNSNVVRKAHQSLRTRVKMRGVKETQDWLAFIDKQQLNETIVQNALHRLENPKTRLEDRIFWIFDPNDSSGIYEKLSSDNIQESINIWKSNQLVSAQANAARLYHILCVCADQNVEKPMLWQAAFQAWQSVISKDEFWENLIDVELKSGFELMLSPREIMDYKNLIWPMLLAYSSKYLQEALHSSKFIDAEKHFIVLNSSNIPAGTVDNIKVNILENFLEEMEKLVKQLLNQLYEKLDKANDDKEKLIACNTALQFYEDQILVRLEFLEKTKSEYFVEKARRLIVSCLRKLSISYYNEIDDLSKCEYVLNEASKIAENTFLVEQIDKDHCAILEAYINNIASDILRDLTPKTREEIIPINAYEKKYNLFREELIPKLEKLKKFAYAHQDKYIKAKETAGVCLKFISFGFIKPYHTNEKSILLLKEAIQLAEGTKVEQDIKSELRNIEKKQKELEYSNHIVNSNKACIVESKQNNIKVPPLCTCCLKKTNDEEKLTYSWQTGNVQESISFHLPLCQDCSVHRREFHTKQMIMFVLVVIVAVITCVSLINFFAVNTAFLSLLIFSVMVITFQFFNKKLPLVLLDTSHATRDKSVQIIGVSTFRFLNPSYAQLFAKANNVAVQEKWIWKHSNEVHFPLLSRASFNVFSSFVVASLICLGIYNNIAEINKQKSNTTASNITSITSPVPVPITSPVTAPLLAKPVKDSKRTNKKIEKIVPTIDIKKDNAYKNKYDNTGNITKYTHVYTRTHTVTTR